MTKTSSHLLSLVLGIVMVVGIFAASLARIPNGVSAAQPTFTDVPATFWAYSYIEKAAADGAVNGVGDNKFNPNGTLTVAQWMVIVTRAFCGDRVDASTATGVWYAKNKDVADQLGLLDGVSNTNMNSAINRYDMAQIVHNLLYMAGCEVMEETGNYSIAVMPDRVADWSSIPAKYQVAVGTVFDNGIIMGTDDKGTFNGSGTFTRAQAAAVYTRMANFMSWDAGMMFPSKLEMETSKNETVKPEDNTSSTPAENASSEKTLKNGKAVTEENVLEIIEELKVKYPDGSTYDPKTAYCSRGIGRSGIECAKLAYMLSDEIFGDLPARTHTDVSKIRPGDVLCFDGGTHWSVATTISTIYSDAPGAYVAGSIDGGSAGIVSWTDTGKFGIPLYSGEYVIYTRYAN